MRIVLGVICLGLAAGCASTGGWLSATSDGKSVESAILWEAKLDDTWTPLDMAALVQDTDRFEQQGAFYKVKDELVVFGHAATFVGMLGVDVLAGPNAVLSGMPQNIAAYLTQHHGAKFEKHGGSYVCDYKTDIKIIIEKHPVIHGASIIIGAYTGP